MQRDLSDKASRRSQAYIAASEGRSLEILREFWREEGVSPMDNRGDTILHFLAIHGNLAGFEILYSNLSIKDLETRNSNGDTPLHEAAKFGKKDVVEMILKKEKDLVFVRNNLGELEAELEAQILAGFYQTNSVTFAQIVYLCYEIC